mgnify:FL=1|tara:strand:+ start:5360 stop:7597 length:2238 start_codon:yes stop_codon:yes gene_type:complete
MSLSSLQLDQSGEFDLLYNFFYVRNYKGEETYDTFALPFTPLTFEPNLTDGIEDFISNKRIVWDFGDGTTTEAVTAFHAYDTPGSYRVNCYLYDRAGTSYYDTFHADVNIKDFVQDELVVTSTADISHAAGQVLNPINVKRYNSFRTLNTGLSTIVPYTSGSGPDKDFFRGGYDKLTYGHLYPNTSFVQILTSSGIVETVPINSVKTIDTPIYIKLSSNEIVYTDVSDTEAFFAGVSGISDVYFKSDFTGDYNLTFGFEQGDIFEYVNTTNYGVSAVITPNVSYNSLEFSSNGIGGEGADNFNVFDINSEKFAGTKIAFVVKVKDDQNFSNRTVPNLSSTQSSVSAINFYLTDGLSTYDAEFTSDFGSLSSLSNGGFYKGYFISNTAVTLNNVYLSGAQVNYNGVFLNGASNTFTINPSSYYTVAKQNENIDFEDAFKEIAIQPLFTDARVLMKDFLGSIFGDLSSTQDSIGKATYEKIQNFLDNNTVIDESNIDQLDSLLQMLDLPKLNKYSLPPKLKRLMDLLSISKSKLFGRRNRDKTQYQSYGYRSNNFYGYNLGEKLTPSSIIIPGETIVATELYSGKFITLNTTLPLSARITPVITITDGIVYGTSTGVLISAASDQISEGVPISIEQASTVNLITSGGTEILTEDLLASSQFYNLSDYNETWGWPLLSGGGRELTDIYSFYYHASSVGDITDSIINFDDPNNTITYGITSYTDWSKDNGIMSNIFANSLYEGLNLFDT